MSNPVFLSNCVLIIRNNSRKNNAGFPTKFVEAFTCGKSIIISKISDVERYCVEGRHIVIENNDIKTISNAILALSSNLECNNDISDTFDYRNWTKSISKIF